MQGGCSNPKDQTVLEVEFVVPCVSRQNNLEYYLGLCDQTDERVESLIKRVRTLQQKNKQIDELLAAQSHFHPSHVQRVLYRELRVLQEQPSFVGNPLKIGRIAFELFLAQIPHEEYREECCKLLRVMEDLKLSG